MLDNFINNKLVVGPSHIIRLQSTMKNDDVFLSENVDFIGLGGIPIWYEDLLKVIQVNEHKFDEIIVLVPDFTFGNWVYENPNQLSFNEYGFFSLNSKLSISPKYIGQNFDQKMYINCIKVLDHLCGIYDKKVRFVFWDLAGKEILNKKENNYILDGVYQHPTYNYRNVISRYKNYVVDIYDDLNINYESYILDRSQHPTLDGFKYLVNKLKIKNNEIFYSEMKAKANQLFDEGKYNESSLIYFKILRATGFDNKMMDKLSLACLFSQNYSLLIYVYELKMEHIKFEPSLMSRVGFCYFKTNFYHKALHLLESAVSINKNQPVALQTIGEIYLLFNDNICAYEYLNSSLLLNNSLSCRTLIEKLLMENKSDKLKGSSFFVKECPQVGLGHNSQLFLLGGAHKIKDYVSGKIKSSDESIDNFFSNVKSRDAFCNERNIEYLHVVFPDTSSILRDLFPYQYKQSMYETYLEKNSDVDVKNKILYPLDYLCSKNNAEGIENEVTLKGDSHLSDVGYRVIVEALINKIDKDNAKELLNSAFSNSMCNYTEIVTAGDLSVKYSPVIKFDKYVFSHKKEGIVIDNGVKSNDGLVRYWTNEDALSEKTILIFGDSYFNFISRYLSLMYKTVIFCRTRFFHDHVVKDIKPDIVLTGNAERYLSVVSSDEKSLCFNNYYNGLVIDDMKYKEFESINLLKNNTSLLQ